MLVCTGPVTTARGGQQPAQLTLGGRAELHDLKAVVGARVGGQRGRAAGVGDDRDPVTPGQRLAGKQRHGVDELTETRGGEDTRLLEQGLLGGQRRRGYRGVRGRAVARRGPGADDGEHWHPLRDPAGRAGELARVAERLHVQDPYLGHLILRPPGQQVSWGHVVLVADRGEGGYADAESGHLLEQRDPHPAGLRDDAGDAR